MRAAQRMQEERKSLGLEGARTRDIELLPGGDIASQFAGDPEAARRLRADAAKDQKIFEDFDPNRLKEETEAAKALKQFNDEIKRFKAEFSGEEIISRTNAMVMGLNQAGGASKLTAEQFSRFKKDVAEAVDVMRARGMDIPPTWRAIAASVEATNRALETTKQLGEDLSSAVRAGSPQLLIPTVQGPISQNASLLGQATPGAPGTASSTWAVTMRNMRDSAYTTADEIRDKFKSAFEQIPELITKSLLHSGGFLNGLKAIGFQMADAIIEPFIKEFIRKLGLAKLGEKIAGAVFGSKGTPQPGGGVASLVGGGGGGGTLGTLGMLGASLFLNHKFGKAGGILGGIGSVIFGGGGIGGGPVMTAGLFGGGGAAAGVGTPAFLAGGGGAGWGLGASLGGLLTNPITGIVAGAALGGFALYRHFNRGSRANDARDKFLSQFAGFDYKRDEANPPGFYGLSALLQKYHHPELFDQLVSAHDPGKVKSAEKAIAAALAVTGRSFHVYHSGGVVPGTGDVPAILQGGERVLNRDEAANYGKSASVTFNIYAWDAVDCERAVRKSIPHLKRHLLLNTDDLLTVTKREVTQ
jgi:hypothetical protein